MRDTASARPRENNDSARSYHPPRGHELTHSRLAWQDLQSKDPYLTPEQDNDDDSKRKQATPDAGDPDVPGVLFDERLRLLDITQWTPIPIPNSLAIGAISHYLEIDYAIIPLFDAELFIQDLVSSQHFFCSPFLVTAVLCWACVRWILLPLSYPPIPPLRLLARSDRNSKPIRRYIPMRRLLASPYLPKPNGTSPNKPSQTASRPLLRCRY